MKCRKNVFDDETKQYNTVWFGSCGLIYPTYIIFLYGNEKLSDQEKKLYTVGKIKSNIPPYGSGETHKIEGTTYEIKDLIIENKKITFTVLNTQNNKFNFSPDSATKGDYALTVSDIETSTGTESEQENKAVVVIGDNYEYKFDEKDKSFELIFDEYLNVDLLLFNTEFLINSKGNDNDPYYRTGIKIVNGELSLPLPMCAKKIESTTQNVNYSEMENSVADSLIQKLSVIKSELWYQINHGLPLFEKVRNKKIFDSVIIDIILNQKEVSNITSFTSKTENNVYYVDVSIMTIYGKEISISTSY